VNAWFEAHSGMLAIVLSAVVAVLLVLTVVFLVLWILAARRRRTQYFARVDAERDALDLEASLKEQLGKLRIVRELNQVAIHSLSTIVSQADGAQFASATDAGVAVRASAAIAESARATLVDLRRIMTVAGGPEESAPPEAPRADFTRELFDLMRDAGLEITTVEHGEPFELQDGPQLAVFRIVQEALSNALKHGGPGTRVTVTSTWTEEGLQVVIDDDGVRAEARRQGLDPDKVAQQRTYTFQDDLDALTEVVVGAGMSEMRERASLYRGILNANMLPGVGFSVSAVFPAIRYDNGIHGVKLREPQR
jgi:signal transduction histidine kinase